MPFLACARRGGKKKKRRKKSVHVAAALKEILEFGGRGVTAGHRGGAQSRPGAMIQQGPHGPSDPLPNLFQTSLHRFIIPFLSTSLINTLRLFTWYRAALMRAKNGKSSRKAKKCIQLPNPRHFESLSANLHPSLPLPSPRLAHAAAQITVPSFPD